MKGKSLSSIYINTKNSKETIENIFKILKLTGNPELPRAKSHLRSDKRSYRELINSSQKNKIERIFAQEIEWGKYHF